LTATFGIGTSFTNDFFKKSTDYKERSKALNMVIKLSSIACEPCVKISDVLTKVSVCSSVVAGIYGDTMLQNTGDPEAVRKTKLELGLTP
jgi:nicotinate phosphoribosyltransferase